MIEIKTEAFAPIDVDNLSDAEVKKLHKTYLVKFPTEYEFIFTQISDYHKKYLNNISSSDDYNDLNPKVYSRYQGFLNGVYNRFDLNNKLKDLLVAVAERMYYINKK